MHKRWRVPGLREVRPVVFNVRSRWIMRDVARRIPARRGDALAWTESVSASDQDAVP